MSLRRIRKWADVKLRSRMLARLGRGTTRTGKLDKKIATCIVSQWRDHQLVSLGDQDGHRLELLERTIATAARTGIAMVFFPAGYFIANDAEVFDWICARVFEVSKKYNMPVAVGIDLASKDVGDKNKDDKKWEKAQVRSGLGFPWYVAVSNPAKGFYTVWNQRSVRGKHSPLGPLHVCEEHRTVPLEDSGIEVLICGEIFNSRIRDSIGARRDILRLAVDLAHDSFRYYVSETMRVFSIEQELPVFCAGHADGRDAVNYAFYPRGQKVTTPQSIFVPAKQIVHAPYLTMRIWTI